MGLAAHWPLADFVVAERSRYKLSSSSAAADSATSFNQPNLPSTFPTAFTMAKGDVVQQDKSFMGMPVSRCSRFQQAGQFQRPRSCNCRALISMPSTAPRQWLYDAERRLWCCQTCAKNSATQLERSGSHPTTFANDDNRASWSTS